MHKQLSGTNPSDITDFFVKQKKESQVFLPMKPWPKSNLEIPSTVKQGFVDSFWNR